MTRSTCPTLTILLFALLTMLASCKGTTKPAAPKACTKAYEQCMLPSGVLGVCDMVECAAEQAPPCLVCRSQH